MIHSEQWRTGCLVSRESATVTPVASVFASGMQAVTFSPGWRVSLQRILREAVAPQPFPNRLS
jgi:hypothetical protein